MRQVSEQKLYESAADSLGDLLWRRDYDLCLMVVKFMMELHDCTLATYVRTLLAFCATHLLNKIFPPFGACRFFCSNERRGESQNDSVQRTRVPRWFFVWPHRKSKGKKNLSCPGSKRKMSNTIEDLNCSLSYWGTSLTANVQWLSLVLTIG